MIEQGHIYNIKAIFFSKQKNGITQFVERILPSKMSAWVLDNATHAHSLYAPNPPQVHQEYVLSL